MTRKRDSHVTYISIDAMILNAQSTTAAMKDTTTKHPYRVLQCMHITCLNREERSNGPPTLEIYVPFIYHYSCLSPCLAAHHAQTYGRLRLYSIHTPSSTHPPAPISDPLRQRKSSAPKDGISSLSQVKGAEAN